MQGYLICPCTGEVPFMVVEAEVAESYVATEEHYAVRQNIDTEAFEWTSAMESWTPLETRED